MLLSLSLTSNPYGAAAIQAFTGAVGSGAAGVSGFIETTFFSMGEPVRWAAMGASHPVISSTIGIALAVVISIGLVFAAHKIYHRYIASPPSALDQSASSTRPQPPTPRTTPRATPCAAPSA